MLDTGPLLLDSTFPGLRRGVLDTLQVNLGYLCNLSCTHCHVNAGPRRTELMAEPEIEAVLAFLRHQDIRHLDLTGGAPEMNPHFRYLVAEARKLGVSVTDRCNLTILLELGYEDLAEFLAQHNVTVTASLPCYQEDNVEAQRGKGVYHDSIAALQHLNALGYGRDADKQLNLVYNPNGAFLPPSQQQLQVDYQQQLQARYGIVFNELLTITNMPISRFGSMLLSKGLYEEYMQLLKDNYATSNLETVMCRSLISVDWQGYVYDCDFNQMLALPMVVSGKSDLIGSDKPKTHLADLMRLNLQGQPIVVADHCYGCTAGQGSSCGGALG